MTTTPVERAAALIEQGIPIGPSMEPCVCGHGRHAHAGAQRTGGCKATGCRRYRADPGWDLARRALVGQHQRLGQALRAGDRIVGAERRKADPVLPGQWRIGVSDVDTCPRAIQYRNRPPADFVPAWEDKREAAMGTAIHDYAETMLKIVYPWREFEQKVTIPGLDRQSRFDWYDPITYTAGDVKTAGSWRWDRLAENGPDEATWDKIHLYGLALNEAGKRVDTVRLDYVKRADGHDESFTRPWSRERAEAARDRLVGYATSLDLGLDLPKTGEGPSVDPLCRRCFARDHCWNIPAAERVGRSPESVTVLGEDPETDAIVWAISKKITAAQAEGAAKKEHENAKVLLDGVKPGRYGDYEGYKARNSNSGKPNLAAYVDALIEAYDLPPAQRPAVEDIPVPTTRAAWHMRWAPVRKATREREAKEAAALDETTDTETTDTEGVA